MENKINKKNGNVHMAESRKWQESEHKNCCGDRNKTSERAQK